MTKINTFDDDSVKRLVATVHRLEAQVFNLQDQLEFLARSRPKIPRAWVLELAEELAATSGTIASNPEVQTADADIVWKNYSSPRDLDYYKPVGATNRRTVSNAFNATISSGERILALEDVYGTLWAIQSASTMSTRTQIIRFKIESIVSSGVSALVKITARPCGMTEVSDEVSGEVTVYDPCGCFLNEPDADLIGRCGWAAYVDPTGIDATGTGTDNSETGTGTDIQQCRWEIFSLCCPSC